MRKNYCTDCQLSCWILLTSNTSVGFQPQTALSFTFEDKPYTSIRIPMLNGSSVIILTLPFVGGGGIERIPPWVFVNNSRKKRRIVTKLSVPSQRSIWHRSLKFWPPAMLDQECMTSYGRSCSDEIGGFCYLSYLGEFRCFMECSFELQAAWLVLMDI